MNRVGKKIVALRKKNGLSQDEFADRIGYARQTVSKWELGDIVPTTKSLQCICDIFNVPIEFFFKEEEIYAPEEIAAAQLPKAEPGKKKGILILIICLSVALVGVLIWLICSITSIYSVDGSRVQYGQSYKWQANSEQIKIAIIAIILVVLLVVILIAIIKLLKQRKKKQWKK